MGLEFPAERAASQNRVVERRDPLAVISVGRDQALLRIREDLILSRSDLHVRSVDPEQAEETARSSGARLWIFCFSIELPKLVYLACSVRRFSPQSKLLLVTGSRPPGFEEALFHRTVSADEDAEGFLEVLSTLALGT